VRVLKVSIEVSPLQRVCPAADTVSKNWEKVAIVRSSCLRIRFFGRLPILSRMRKPDFEPRIPARGTKVPDRPECFHEIKHDGLPPDRSAGGQIPYSCGPRNGYDWSNRYPCVVEAALRHRPDSFVLDGEAVLLGVDGIADFNGLHSRKH